MSTWSLTPYFNEIDVLEIRLAELDPVVDVFVLAEATRTHSGQLKPMTLGGHLHERLLPWAAKIRIVTVQFPSPLEMMRSMGKSAPQSINWTRENYQRNQLKEGLLGLQENDLVILSDLDEIPNAELVRSVAAGGVPIPIAVSVPIFTYRLNWRWPSVEDGFAHIRFFRGWSLLPIPGHDAVGPQAMFEAPMPSLVGDYGWHFSYVGDAAHIHRKIEALADDWIKEDPSWRDADHIEHSIETGVDVFGRGYRNATLVPDESLPVYVQEHRDRFAHILA